MNDDRFRLAGRVALITGAGGGIGSAIGQRFRREGATVVLADLDTTAVEATANRLCADTDEIDIDIDTAATAAVAIACDVTSPESTAAAVDTTVDRFGRLDILVNNAAARTPGHTVETLQLADWQAALDVNLTGAFLMSRAAIAVMTKQRSGVIIHMASQLGHVGSPQRAVYAATKAALISLARTMAIDHGPDGIRVASLSPGAVLTSRLEDRYGSLDAATEALAHRYPAGRLGQAEEVAAAAAYLASDEAAFLTGTDLLIDGGYTA